MGRRKGLTKAQSAALAPVVLVLGVLGAIGAAVAKFFETFGFWGPALVVAIGVFSFFLLQAYRRRLREQAALEEQRAIARRQAELEEERKRAARSRREHLMEKYGDVEIVARIVHGKVWQGQTSHQLSDSLGEPEAVDERVLKTKSKQVWKYRHQGGNRYGLRVTLENGLVVGWDEKD